MKNKFNAYYFFPLAGILLVITTIGIHSSLFEFHPETTEESMSLYKIPKYIFSKWWVIIHCLLVIFVAWAIKDLKNKKPAFGFELGFLFYVIFSITEILRHFLALFYMNGLRARYLSTDDPVVQQNVVEQLESFGLVANALFGLFIFAFALGNLFYGISLLIQNNWRDKLLGFLLFLWSIQGFLVLGNEFWRIDSMGSFLDPFSLFYQPFVRFVTAIWLFLTVKEKFGNQG